MKRLVRLAIAALKFLHLSVLLFIILGWLLPQPLWLQIHLAIVPLTILQWQFNQGTCILTNLENALRGEVKNRQEQQGQFIKGLLGRCYNPLPSDRAIKRTIYLIMGLAWTISALRLATAVLNST